MSFFHRNIFAIFIAIFSLSLPSLAFAKLNIGITLHPYYSYVTNIVGDKAILYKYGYWKLRSECKIVSIICTIKL